MASPAKTIPQDLPPKGGYGPIQIERIPLRKLLSARAIIGGFLALSTLGWSMYFLNYKRVRRHDIEMRSARHAVLPLLLAERDRAVLRQIRKIRDEETDLMKNIEGWETGTYFGERVFQTLPEDKLIEPSELEYFSHSGFLNVGNRFTQDFFL